MSEDNYSKPLAPADDQPSNFKSPPDFGGEADKQPLTNADFRRLLQTPRVPSSEKPRNQTDRRRGAGDSTHSFSHRLSNAGGRSQDASGGRRLAPTEGTDGNESALARKNIHAVKNREKTEEDELNDILKNYRDRAKERRQGEVQESQQEMDLIQASGYKAVAPDLKGNFDLAEKRKKLIEESKYLGGDMEHTHLVKGLDYSLLQKVRSEILSKEREEDDLERAYQAQRHERDEVESQLKSVLTKNLYQILFKEDSLPKAVNDHFAPRRMAYVVDLDDEGVANDGGEIPTVLIRSKQDCPIDDTSANLSINDMVIQKLTQVLSYLRADNKKKRKGKIIPDDERVKLAGQGIYEDVGDYVPTVNKTAPYSQKSDSDKQSAGHAHNSGKYFDKPSATEGQRSKNSDDSRHATIPVSTGQKYGSKHEKNAASSKSIENSSSADQSAKPNKSKGQKQQLPLDSYAECYPGGMECYDAAGDSDDDADFSKMDLGNKKGPIRRWDFETEVEYEEYMSRREALPKAAFQYGVKMLDGRKTRKLPGGMKNERDDKAKLDRQWAKISQILSKRKDTDDGNDKGDELSAKKIKF